VRAALTTVYRVGSAPLSYEALGFVPLEGVREGLLPGEPLPMFIGIETVGAAIER
jgi:hypothetical protein